MLTLLLWCFELQFSPDLFRHISFINRDDRSFLLTFLFYLRVIPPLEDKRLLFFVQMNQRTIHTQRLRYLLVNSVTQSLRPLRFMLSRGYRRQQSFQSVELHLVPWLMLLYSYQSRSPRWLLHLQFIKFITKVFLLPLILALTLFLFFIFFFNLSPFQTNFFVPISLVMLDITMSCWNKPYHKCIEADI